MCCISTMCQVGRIPLLHCRFTPSRRSTRFPPRVHFWQAQPSKFFAFLVSILILELEKELEVNRRFTTTFPIVYLSVEIVKMFFQGRYLQMMRLLRPIASDVMNCISQIFDYYLFVVSNMFPCSLFLSQHKLTEWFSSLLSL